MILGGLAAALGAVVGTMCPRVSPGSRHLTSIVLGGRKRRGGPYCRALRICNRRTGWAAAGGRSPRGFASALLALTSAQGAGHLGRRHRGAFQLAGDRSILRRAHGRACHSLLRRSPSWLAAGTTSIRANQAVGSWALPVSSWWSFWYPPLSATRCERSLRIPARGWLAVVGALDPGLLRFWAMMPGRRGAKACGCKAPNRSDRRPDYGRTTTRQVECRNGVHHTSAELNWSWLFVAVHDHGRGIAAIPPTRFLRGLFENGMVRRGMW